MGSDDDEVVFPSDRGRTLRRAGCLVVGIGGALVLVIGLVAAFAFGSSADGADELCEDLQIQLTYLEAAPSAGAARADIQAQLDEARCDD